MNWSPIDRSGVNRIMFRIALVIGAVLALGGYFLISFLVHLSIGWS